MGNNVKRYVYYIRHAKSAWDRADLTDIERPLNDRGHRTAEKMADFIFKKEHPDNLQLISSPANRALSTAVYFAKRFHYSKDDIIEDKNLYYGNESDYLKCLNMIKPSLMTAFVFGHNPIIEYLLRNLQNPYNDAAPTCAVFKTSFESDDWKIGNFNELKIEKYYLPKLILD